MTKPNETTEASPKPASRPTVTDAFAQSFGESLLEAMDVDQWRADRNLAEEYYRMESEVHQAVAEETEMHEEIRARIFPRISWRHGAPEGAGVFHVAMEEIRQVHRGLLFRGGVEACDGTSQVHDALPVTIHQLGVSLVSYRGDHSSWCQRLFRRDLRLTNRDPIEETLELLERRGLRNGLNRRSPEDVLSELAQRAIMSYAERAILLRHSNAIWRMGHGSPAPLELLLGGGFADLIIESIRVIRGLIEDHQKFVFVASEPGDRAWMTIGHALRPMEYAIIESLDARLAPQLEQWSCNNPPTGDIRWDGEELTPWEWVARFRDTVAPKVVVGLYRATRLSPVQLFYAHQDHAEIAVRIAMADSMLQEQRGFPLLIDLADKVCRSIYGGGSLSQHADLAYTAAGAPFRYQSERANRPGG